MITGTRSFSTLKVAPTIFGLAGSAMVITVPHLFLANHGADWITQVTLSLALMALYMLNFVDFLRHPDQAVIGYKG
jgi:hypothetical protein